MIYVIFVLHIASLCLAVKCSLSVSPCSPASYATMRCGGEATAMAILD